jgi:hypothetical protein
VSSTLPNSTLNYYSLFNLTHYSNYSHFLLLLHYFHYQNLRADHSISQNPLFTLINYYHLTSSFSYIFHLHLNFFYLLYCYKKVFSITDPLTFIFKINIFQKKKIFIIKIFFSYLFLVFLILKIFYSWCWNRILRKILYYYTFTTDPTAFIF